MSESQDSVYSEEEVLKLLTERRPDGDTRCIGCGFTAKTANWTRSG